MVIKKNYEILKDQVALVYVYLLKTKALSRQNC